MRIAAVLAAAITVSACGGDAGDAEGRPGRQASLIVFNAGSLAHPLRAALDTFALREGIRVEQESAGSLESARKLTELNRTPDVIALADHEVFGKLLLPAHTTWYVQFARNRMVLAFTDRSAHAAEITGANWWEVVQRRNVAVGRADPNLDPNGYRTLLTMQLAERHYGRPGLARALLATAPERNVRPKESDLIALLQIGELDYIWSYESLARSAGLRHVTLPREIDLGTPADSARYAEASVRVAGGTPGDSITFRGAPIVYGISIPAAAPHRQLAERFMVWLLSADGRRVLREARLDALEAPVAIGKDIPEAIGRRVAR